MKKYARMYGSVKHKHARHNLIVADFDQDPLYEEGKGTVINFSHLPLLSHIRNNLYLLFGEKTKNLFAEANHYFDVNKCGIGYHGDKERTMVIGLRLGPNFPLTFYWYLQNQRISSRIEILLHSGDLYVMSAKAVGFDSGLKKIPTLRHAAGCEKYIR